MKYHYISKDDMLNGDGLRVALWVAGCEHHCPGCQNAWTWDPNDPKAKVFDVWDVIKISGFLKEDYISGITYSGGDPLHPANRTTITTLAKAVSIAFPEKTQWLYTGYSWDEVKHLAILQYIDVIKTGRFNKEQREVDVLNHHLPHWMGDSSQELRRKIDGVWVLTNEYSENKKLEEAHMKECGCGE